MDITTPLQSLIAEQLRERGAMNIADYMTLALSHPEHGYYMRKDPFGRKGDFITAPEISQIFGELLGAWCADFWQQMGGGELQLVEMGPGRGTLMKDVLRATKNVPGFHDSICITMMEMSPELKEIQEETLAEAHPRIHWQSDLADLPRLPALFLANEFFDALPIRQFVKSEEGLKEKMVELDPEAEEEDALRFTVLNTGLSLVKGGGGYSKEDDGKVVESCPAARGIMQTICDHLATHGGGGLIIDYGYVGGSRGCTLQAVRDHGFHNVLEKPGKADLTAHVDFDALQKVVNNNNFFTFDVIGQGALLMRLGAEMRTEVLMRNASDEQSKEIITAVERLISPAQMGGLFKAMSFTSYDSVTPAAFDRGDWIVSGKS